MSLVHWITYGGIRDCAEMGVDFTYYQDIFIINCLVQLSTTLSDWCWLLYLSVPAFLIYKSSRFFLNWIFTPEPVENDDARLEKKRMKMERKAQRGQIRIIR